MREVTIALEALGLMLAGSLATQVVVYGAAAIFWHTVDFIRRKCR
jgi:hypothetical protein